MRVELTEVFPSKLAGLEPTSLAQIPGDPSRWFVASRYGRLMSFSASGDGDLVTVANLATLTGLVVQPGGEAGFLGFAFHPRFAENGRVYVYWSSADGTVLGVPVKARIGFITTVDGGGTAASYTPLFDFDQRSYQHQGGGIAFGRQGHLYLSFGESAVPASAQRKEGFFGKVVRLDVDNVPPGEAYGIPPDNPFVSDPGAEPTAFAYGFRNPFRLSIDRETGDVWVGDVGASAWEEINVVRRGGNYGWPCREGTQPYLGPPSCPIPTGGHLVDPLFAYPHGTGESAARSITGGVVYRGKAIPSLVGRYVFGDFITGAVLALSFNPSTGLPEVTELNPTGPRRAWTQFAEGDDGEITAVAFTGELYALGAASPSPPVSAPRLLSETGCVDPDATARPASGAIPYGVNVDHWADGAAVERFFALPDGQSMTADPATGHIDAPPGTVLAQTFVLGGKRVETRLLVRHDDGGWAGYSYEWLDDESDAALLPSSKRKTVGGRSWYYPSRGECVRCHSEAAGRTLGLTLSQLDRSFVYTSTNRISNQLATFVHTGLLAPAAVAPGTHGLPSLDRDASAEAKARAYLDVNCSSCHRPGGETSSGMDLRHTTPFAQTGTCDVEGARGDFGVAGAKLIVPGSPDRSLLALRGRALGAGRMPPIASDHVDARGLGLLESWIGSIAACP